MAVDRAASGGGILVPINTGLTGLQPNSAAGIQTGSPADWFGPGNPLAPIAPPEVRGRSWDFPVAYNLTPRPRKYEPITFELLRGLAQSYDLMRIIIETRKDQVAHLEWSVGPKAKGEKATPEQQARADKIKAFFEEPQKGKSWETWIRLLLEDLLVIDAPTIYPRLTRGGQLYELRVFDGATINRVIDDWGETPDPPAPAYQQILKGLQAVDYTADQLLYLPRNPRPGKAFGFSPVEQIVTIVNIALRREMWQLNFFTEGTLPDALIGTPAEWTPDQLRAFQEDWDAKQQSPAGGRRGVRFVPGEVAKGYVNIQDTELFGAAEEWFARVCCFAFSISPQPFVKMQNRATAETAQEVAQEEGVVPLKAWLKSLIDLIIRVYFKSPDLALGWAEEEEIDQKSKSEMLVNEAAKGVRTIDEARDELGLDPLGEGFDKPMVLVADGYTPVHIDDQLAQEKARIDAGVQPDPTKPDPSKVAALEAKGSPGPDAGQSGAAGSDARKGAEPVALDKYREDQLRDDHGRFADEGGGAEAKPGEPGASGAQPGAGAGGATKAPTVEDVEAALKEGGLKFVTTDDMTRDQVRVSRIDVKAPVEMNEHALEGAKELTLAMRDLRDNGFDTLADHVQSSVPIAAGPLRDINPETGEYVKDTGTIMATLSGPSGEMIVINTNAAYGFESPIHEFSPLTTVQAREAFEKTGDHLAAARIEMRGAAIHELGHVLDHMTGRGMSASLMRTLYARFPGGRGGDSWVGKNISGYARVSEDEAAAEAFTRIVQGATMPPLLDTWVAQVRKAGTYGH